MSTSVTNPNDDSRFDVLERLFEKALDLPEVERLPWLERECSQHPERLTLVLQLLQSHYANEDERISPLLPKVTREEVPISIGPYRIARLVAEGGVGAVYDATHEGTGRRAAIKLIRTGFVTNTQKLRFQLEAELLGKLNHPGIAQLYDAGVAEVTYGTAPMTRRPFIAMEYVEGVPVSTYAKVHSLGIRERVKLIVDAASAIQHAHHRGIIHRDLKPGNLLVNAEGRLKVVDFGVARLIETSDSLTHEGMALGTPNFMSPEQLTGRNNEVDLPADVYGLGATLYLLLTGKPPLGATGLLTPAVALRLLVNEIRDVRTQNSAVDQDLAAVTHRALERNIKDRYPDAAELAADLQRWLDGLPTQARPLGSAARVNKWIRRHPWRSVAMLLLAIATISTLVQFILASRAVARERIAIQENAAAVEFLNNILMKVSPETSGSLGPDQKLSDLIAEAEKDVVALSDRPRVEAQVRLTLSKVNFSLGRLEPCEKNAQAVIQIFERLHEDSDVAVRAQEILALAYKERGRLAEVCDLRWSIWHWRLKRQGANHPDTLWAEAEWTFAEVEAGKPHYPAPSRYLEEIASALDSRRTELDSKWTNADEAHLIRCRELVAVMYGELIDQPKSLADHLSKAISESTNLNGPNHPQTLRLERIRAVVLYRRGDFAEAKAAVLAVRARLAPKIGENHPTILLLDGLLGSAMAELGEVQAAFDLHSRISPQIQSALGLRHFQTVASRQRIAADLRMLGRLDEADSLLQQCLLDYEKVDGPTLYAFKSCFREIALLRQKQGRLAEAANIFEIKIFHDVNVNQVDHIVYVELGVWLMEYAAILDQLGSHDRAKVAAELGCKSIAQLESGAGHLKRAEALLARLSR